MSSVWQKLWRYFCKYIEHNIHKQFTFNIFSALVELIEFKILPVMLYIVKVVCLLPLILHVSLIFSTVHLINFQQYLSTCWFCKVSCFEGFLIWLIFNKESHRYSASTSFYGIIQLECKQEKHSWSQQEQPSSSDSRKLLKMKQP